MRSNIILVLLLSVLSACVGKHVNTNPVPTQVVQDSVEAVAVTLIALVRSEPIKVAREQAESIYVAYPRVIPKRFFWPILRDQFNARHEGHVAYRNNVPHKMPGDSTVTAAWLVYNKKPKFFTKPPEP